MKLKLAHKVVDLNSTQIMGVIDIHTDNVQDIDYYINCAKSMQEDGASFVELAVVFANNEANEILEQEIVVPIIKALKQNCSLYIAINTPNPKTMQDAVAAGACMIIDNNSLRAPNALATVKELDVPVCLVFDQNIEFDSLDKQDPMSSVSEFLYERIDACLNANIKRSRILIDPSLGINTALECRLKMAGRLNTFKSFGLPISIQIPRSIPHEDKFLEDNLPITLSLAIYLQTQGIHIIRTKQFADLALGLETFEALSRANRPFRLTKAIAKRFLKKKKQ